MKNIFYSVVALSLMLFASCDNENSVNPQTEELGSATISGKLKIQLDTADLDPIPAGTQVVVTIDAEDLVLNPVDDYNYGERKFYTETAADGSYTITIENIPANRSISTDVDVEAFRYTFRYDDDANPDLEESEEFVESETNIGNLEIYSGGSFIRDYDY